MICLFDEWEAEALGTLPSLERACLFATWCLIARLRREAQYWLRFAESFAESAGERARSPRVKG